MRLRTLALIIGLCLTFVAPPAEAARRGKKDEPIVNVPIIMLRKHYVTNCHWSSEQVRMGGEEVATYITGHGGEHDATARYTLDGDHRDKYEMFEATIGYKDDTVEGREATFEIWVNGVKVVTKGPLVSGDKPEKIRANIKGAREVLLRIVPQHYNDTMNAMWGDPTLSTKFVAEEEDKQISVSGENHSYQAVPNTFKGEQEFELPLPLFTGTHEFKVHYEYDAQRQRVKYTLEHINAHPEVGHKFTSATSKPND